MRFICHQVPENSKGEIKQCLNCNNINNCKSYDKYGNHVCDYYEEINIKKLKSFKTVIYMHRSKEENFNIVDLAFEKGFEASIADKLKYLGYEFEIEVEIFEDGTIKIINPENIKL